MRHIIAASLLLSLAPLAGMSANRNTKGCALVLAPDAAYRLKKVAPRVFHLAFDEHSEMAHTFMRFQEHYESPEFRGKIFSRKEFKSWYRLQKNGRFTYISDWGGFNIPSYVLEPFYSGQFQRITRRERILLEQFRELHERQEKFYIIGTPLGNKPTLDHEIAHGLYYSNQDYRAKANKILDAVDLGPIYRWLSGSGGYHESVWRDEAHAYLLDSPSRLFESIGADPREYWPAVKRLRANFMKHSGRTVRD